MTEEQAKLVTENHNLIYSYLHKYNLDIDENYGMAALGLCRAAETYEESKGKFSTYAYRCMLNIFRNEHRRLNCQRAISKDKLVYYDKLISSEGEGEIYLLDTLASKGDITKLVELRLCIDQYLDSCTESSRKIIIMCMMGYPQRDIANKLNCSGAKVSRTFSKFKKHVERSI